MDISTTAHEKKVQRLASVGSAIVLVCLKIFIVVATAAWACFPEALHSSLDLIAALITYLSVRFPTAPPTPATRTVTPKFESFSAFVETALLLVTAITLFTKQFAACFSGRANSPDVSFHRIAGRSSMRGPGAFPRARAALLENIPGEALEADALHFSHRRLEHPDRHAGHGRRACRSALWRFPGCATPIRLPRSPSLDL